MIGAIAWTGQSQVRSLGGKPLGTRPKMILSQASWWNRSCLLGSLCGLSALMLIRLGGRSDATYRRMSAGSGVSRSPCSGRIRRHPHRCRHSSAYPETRFASCAGPRAALSRFGSFSRMGYSFTWTRTGGPWCSVPLLESRCRIRSQSPSRGSLTKWSSSRARPLQDWRMVDGPHSSGVAAWRKRFRDSQALNRSQSDLPTMESSRCAISSVSLEISLTIADMRRLLPRILAPLMTEDGLGVAVSSEWSLESLRAARLMMVISRRSGTASRGTERSCSSTVPTSIFVSSELGFSSAMTKVCSVCEMRPMQASALRRNASFSCFAAIRAAA